jgi:hypothetical protein
MQRDADDMLRAPRQKFARSEHIRHEFFEVIPFDSVLVKLLDVMQKHGLTAGAQVTVGDSTGSNDATEHPCSIAHSACILDVGMSLSILRHLLHLRSRVK